MDHALGALVLSLATTAWFVLPFLPALDEFFRRKDIEPLRVSGAAANIRHFALSFRSFVDRQLPALRELTLAGQAFSTLADGSTVWYVAPANGPIDLYTESSHKSAEQPVVISEASLHVQEQRTIVRELFTAGSLAGGRNVSYRAVLAGADATLGAESTVLRWIDAGGVLRVGADSVLWGRASCSRAMLLGDGVRFQRLAAPRIVFGESPRRDGALGAEKVAPAPRIVVEAPRGTHVGAGRWVIDGDFSIPANGDVCCDLVLTGTLALGAGAALQGAVRCTVLSAADDCTFDGAVVATERLTAGAHCRIVGPIVVEGEATFGECCRIGNPGDETTISAVSVRVGRGTVLCGEVWARDQGVVTSTVPKSVEPLALAT